LAALWALTVQGATFGGADPRNTVERLSALPLFTSDSSLSAVWTAWEAPGARLAGLAVTLPTVSAEALASLAGVREDFLKALEKVELPIAPTVGAGFAFRDRELPWPTIIAFAGGGLMLVALGVFGGALLKMSLEEQRKSRRMRRRYAP